MNDNGRPATIQPFFELLYMYFSWWVTATAAVACNIPVLDDVTLDTA